MGAQQSSAQGQPDAGAGAGSAKTCYYELLGVEREATEDEIKKAYKRKALELHPDRNYGDVDNATQRFAEVQSAYEVLSDPQERSWYDSHREAILKGVDADDLQNQPPEFNNVRLTSTEDILNLIRRFNATVPFTDDSSGFFGIARETFAHLADEEVAAGYHETGEVPEFPDFGSSSSDFETVARPFYAVWSSFSTRKHFAWKDKYRLSDAPDRRIRRLMEKDNKKLRDDAIRDFNDTVRFLVNFVRKRDPRYLPNSQTHAERQASLRSAAAAQAARSRAENQKRAGDEADAVPEWARSRAEEDNESTSKSAYFSHSESESEIEQIECVVCDKVFKSEKSFEAHERSKKHIKATLQLQRHMRKDNALLGIREEDLSASKGASEERSARNGPQQESRVEADSDTSPARLYPKFPKSPNPESSTESDSAANSEETNDDDYAPREDVANRLHANDNPTDTQNASLGEASLLDIVENPSATNEDDSTSVAPAKKVGKAREKRNKKAARQAAGETQTQALGHVCGVCRNSFPSKTKLFNHIRELGHAELKTVPASQGKKSKYKK